MEYLADSLFGYVQNDAKTKDIFQELDRIHEGNSIATQLAVRETLLTLKLEGDTKLSKHFMQFDELISDLIAAGAKIDENDKIAHLLLTVPSLIMVSKQVSRQSRITL